MTLVGSAPTPRGWRWLVTFEDGPVSEAVGQAGSFFHELFHDGRHLIGVPCH